MASSKEMLVAIRGQCIDLLPVLPPCREGKRQTLAMDQVTPATKLLEKRRQMFEVQERLEQERHEFQKKEASFKKREDEIKRRDNELKDRLIRFSKFLQENDSKKARAERKANGELRVKKQKEEEISELEEELKRLHKIKVCPNVHFSPCSLQPMVVG